MAYFLANLEWDISSGLVLKIREISLKNLNQWEILLREEN